MDKTLYPLSQAEWTKLEKRTSQVYQGTKPNKENTKKLLFHVKTLDVLTILTWTLLLAAMLFSIFKAIDPAVEFADSYHAVESLSPVAKIAFRWVTIVAVSLAVSTGLIFTTLKATDPDVLKMQDEFLIQWRLVVLPINLWRLEVLTPRLWTIITYAIVGWLLWLSNQGAGSYFIKFIPVILEVVLAHLVSDTAKKNRIKDERVFNLLQERLTTWETRYHQRYASEEFLTALFQNLREALSLLGGKKNRKNAWLRQADSEAVLEAITAEYERLIAGQHFADNILKKGITPKTTAEQGAFAYPPNGTNRWTVDLLIADFHRRGLDRHMEYTQKDLDPDYASGTAYRTAFKNGAKDYFWRNR